MNFSKTLLLIAAAMAMPMMGMAQSWSEVSTSGKYYFGEGVGASQEEADNHALAMLLRSISVGVKSSVVQKQENEKLTFSASIETYSSATLENSEMLVISRSPEYKVGRWISKNQVYKVFESRKHKVMELCDAAELALMSGKIDIALKDYHWAFTLLKSVPEANAVQGYGHTLMTWIPEQIYNILGDIRVNAVSRNEDDVEIMFTYKGRPVNSIDYVYFDGGFESQLCSAKDGIGMMELTPGTSHDNYRVQIEVEYRDQSRLDGELQAVMSVTPVMVYKDATINFKGVKGDQPQLATNSADMSASTSNIETTHAPSVSINTSSIQKPASAFSDVDPSVFKRPKTLDNTANYTTITNRIIDAINKKSYNSVSDVFTKEGASRFHRLAKYGNAKVVSSNSDITFTPYGDQVVARGLRLAFSFRGGVRKNFVEDVVFTFNKDNLVDNVTFGLGNTVNDNILGNSFYPENVRLALAEFLENYQTAYALKDLSYLESIFDEDALIIVGKVLQSANNRTNKELNKVVVNPQSEVEYIRFNKQSFMDHLRQSFGSKEYINLRFNNCRIQKAAMGGEIYGIELEQDYYSNNYSDHGYLFLEINMNKPNQPMILIRTWQPQPDPEFGLYSLDYFPASYSIN